MHFFDYIATITVSILPVGNHNFMMLRTRLSVKWSPMIGYPLDSINTPPRRGSTRPEMGGGCDCPVLLWSAGHTCDSVGQIL